jgi:hypothetical protein
MLREPGTGSALPACSGVIERAGPDERRGASMRGCLNPSLAREGSSRKWG